VTYLLDTNAVIALLKNQPNAVRKQPRRAAAKGASIRVSSVVLFELCMGLCGANAVVKTPNGCVSSSRVPSASFPSMRTPCTPVICAPRWKRWERQSALMILIAAQALRIGATLVTANASEFARVNGLVWQDWATKS
jgi:tRNA(fMet)-specific endonuclease VapC